MHDFMRRALAFAATFLFVLGVASVPAQASEIYGCPDGRVCLLRQYRYATGGWLWELPAGKIDNREPPLDTARRELAEEAGREAAAWQELGFMHSSPGILTEVVYLYLARNLTPTAIGHEHEEVIEVHWLPLGEALTWCRDGRISDAKTLIGLFRAQAVLA